MKMSMAAVALAALTVCGARADLAADELTAGPQFRYEQHGQVGVYRFVPSCRDCAGGRYEPVRPPAEPEAPALAGSTTPPGGKAKVGPPPGLGERAPAAGTDDEARAALSPQERPEDASPPDDALEGTADPPVQRMAMETDFIGVLRGAGARLRRPLPPGEAPDMGLALPARPGTPRVIPESGPKPERTAQVQGAADDDGVIRYRPPVIRYKGPGEQHPPRVWRYGPGLVIED